MNPIKRIWASLVAPWRVLFDHFPLIVQLVRQDIRVTYARSVLGLYWVVLLPLLYVLVFIGVRFVVLERGGDQWIPNQMAPETTLWSAFALTLGLLVFWLASEILGRAPGIMQKHSSLVTEVKFPVEVLPWTVVGLSLFNFGIRFLLLVVMHFALLGVPVWELALVPLAVVPLVVFMVGIAYLFAAVGAFLSDLEYVIQILMTALLLMSGVLFPLTLVPEPYSALLYLNPIAFMIEEARKLALDGQMPNLIGMALLMVVGLSLSMLGFLLFRRWQPRFSDVL